ncbi:MAG: glycosyltransferase family 1 protein [Patescibacteria group bacterium]|nr:glycosyltransferase family 1 protein [Patescibacteria group bacterium]
MAKIAVDARVLMDENWSGVGEYVYNLVDNLLKADTKNEYWLFYNSAKNLTGKLPDFNNVQTIKTSIPNKILNYGFFKILNWPTVDVLMKEKFDIFLMPHINFISLPKNTANILTVHDISFLSRPEFFSKRRNFWHRMVNVKQLTNKVSHIVAISENTKNDLMDYCAVPEDKIKVIYSGIADKYFQSSDRLNNFCQGNYILYLGTIEPRKNIENLVRAYEILRFKNSSLADYKLVIAGGKGWKCEADYEAINNSLFADDIIVTGYITDEEKIALYNQAKLFVFPSFYEGFGFPPLEAMASGVPVVASSLSSLPEIVGEVALLANPYDAHDLAMAIEHGLLDQTWREFSRLKGIEIAKLFNWQKTAQAYLRLFEEIK